MRVKKYEHAFNIFLVILSMITIFLFSHQTASESTDTSKKFAKEVVSIVVKDDVKKAEKLEIKIDKNLKLIRKNAHLIEYFILGFLVINLIKDYKKINKKYIILAIFLVAIYACTDEFHQLFIMGRSASFIDVLIDTLGSSLGIMLYYGIYSHFQKKKLTN